MRWTLRTTFSKTRYIAQYFRIKNTHIPKREPTFKFRWTILKIFPCSDGPACKEDEGRGSTTFYNFIRTFITRRLILMIQHNEKLLKNHYCVIATFVIVVVIDKGNIYLWSRVHDNILHEMHDDCDSSWPHEHTVDKNIEMSIRKFFKKTTAGNDLQNLFFFFFHFNKIPFCLFEK